jgi:hypothetical protein
MDRLGPAQEEYCLATRLEWVVQSAFVRRGNQFDRTRILIRVLVGSQECHIDVDIDGTALKTCRPSIFFDIRETRSLLRNYDTWGSHIPKMPEVPGRPSVLNNAGVYA